jgi:hypothetical protein
LYQFGHYLFLALFLLYSRTFYFMLASLHGRVYLSAFDLNLRACF